MFPLDVIATTLAQTIVSDATTTGLHAASGLLRAKGRRERLSSYEQFQHSVVRAQLRLDSIFAVHSAQYNVLHVAAWATGYPLVVNLMNHASDDMADVVTNWRRIRLIGNPAAVSAAEELALTLVDYVSKVDPGWHKPQARRAFREHRSSSTEAMTASTQKFELAMQADAAPQWRDRKSSKRQLG